MYNKSKKRDLQTVFKNPFSAAYWKLAASEFADLKMLLIAALVAAVRVALRPWSNALAIAPNLTINLSFWISAAGSMIYGPLVGLLSGALSDTLSCILFPSGPYFFPFVFVEMLGCFVFALFLYRAKITALRVVLSRVAVVISCNFILNPLIMILYYRLFYSDKSYTFYSVMLTVLKALITFPFEALILVVFISAISPALAKMKLVAGSPKKLKVNTQTWIVIAVLFVLSAAALFLVVKFGLYDTLKSYLKEWLK